MIIDIFSEYSTPVILRRSKNFISSTVQKNPFAEIITPKILRNIIQTETAFLPQSITGQKQISEHYSKRFEEKIAGLDPNWVWGNSDDNKSDVLDVSTDITLEIKVALCTPRKTTPTKIPRDMLWRGGAVQGRLREGWHLLFARSRDNAEWAVYFAFLNNFDWAFRTGHAGHFLEFNTIINSSQSIPVIYGSQGIDYFATGFLPDYSRINKKQCEKVSKLFEQLSPLEQSYVLKQNGV